MSNSSMRDSVVELISSEEAAKLLDIPLIALGQVVFDKKLSIFHAGDYEFSREQVYKLFLEEQSYLDTLR